MSPGETSSLYLALSLDHQLNHSVGHLLPPSTRPLKPAEFPYRVGSPLPQMLSLGPSGKESPVGGGTGLESGASRMTLQSRGPSVPRAPPGGDGKRLPETWTEGEADPGGNY